MKRNGFNVLLWILSVFFFLSTFVMFSTSWVAILFIVPAILLNPPLSEKLQEKFNFRSGKGVKISAAMIPLIIFSAVMPAAPTVAGANNLVSSSVSSSTAVVSSEAEKILATQAASRRSDSPPQ